MKIAKRIIFILLLLSLLLGAFLLNPLIRFTIDLRRERFENAQTVYLTHLIVSDGLEKEAGRQLNRYVDRQLNRYYLQELSGQAIMDILSSLSKTRLPQIDIERGIRAVDEMETARADLAKADACLAKGEYADAILLFRKSLIADDSAALRLKQAESDFEEQILNQAVTYMDAGQHEEAETVLLKGRQVLGADDDLSAALSDVRRMASERAYAAVNEEFHRLLVSDGPEAAFLYIAELRRQTPDAYELEYLEQLLLHDYETDICSRAGSLRDAGDPVGACSLLEEGLELIVSDRMKALHAEIKATISIDLGDMPVLMDETGDARFGQKSTVNRDLVLSDALSNRYEHSFSADTGTVSFSLRGAFAMFTGTVAFPSEEKADIYRTSASLQVFGDGRLIAEFKDMEAASAPIPFSIPVDGIQELSLSWTSEGAGGWKDWGRFATIFDGKLLAAAPNPNIE